MINLLKKPKWLGISFISIMGYDVSDLGNYPN